MNIFKNQYVITDRTIGQNCPVDFLKNIIGTFNIYHDVNLSFSIKKQEQVEIGLLGFILDPLSPTLSNEEILEYLLVATKSNFDLLQKELQKYSGRFVLIYKIYDSYFAINDCCGLRQIYFNLEGSFVMSSCPELILSALGYTINVDKTLNNLLLNKQFFQKEFAWFKDTWYDSRIKKVLPNHYLSIIERSIYRTEYYYNGPDDYDSILNYAKSILNGSFEAIHHRYINVIQPITAGWDSRILLAASQKFMKRTKYYLFDKSDMNQVDSIIAKKLADRLGLEFKLIYPNHMESEFISNYSKRFAIPRLIHNTVQIQWHLYNSQLKGTININGNGGEIVRNFYFGTNRSATINELTKISGYGDIFKSDLIRWIEESRRFSDLSGIGNLDLFYWEQRMGNWGAMYPYEQDIAIEEYSPFNNKNLIYSIFKINYGKRGFPNYKFFRDLIKQLWPDTLKEQINPIIGCAIKSRIKKILKSSPAISGILRKFKN